MQSLEPSQLIVGGIIIFTILVIINLSQYFRLWLKAHTAGKPLSMPHLIAMKVRGTPFAQVVNSGIALARAGYHIPYEHLEAHALAGGRLEQVVNAMTVTRQLNIEPTFDQICALDLALQGKNVDLAELVRRYQDTPRNILQRVLEDQTVTD